MNQFCKKIKKTLVHLDDKVHNDGDRIAYCLKYSNTGFLCLEILYHLYHHQFVEEVSTGKYVNTCLEFIEKRRLSNNIRLSNKLRRLLNKLSLRINAYENVLKFECNVLCQAYVSLHSKNDLYFYFGRSLNVQYFLNEIIYKFKNCVLGDVICDETRNELMLYNDGDGITYGELINLSKNSNDILDELKKFHKSIRVLVLVLMMRSQF
jgi:hypothetical protein